MPITTKLWVRITLMARYTRYSIMGEILSGRLFSPGTLVSSTNKTDLYNITEILLKVALKEHISPVLCTLHCIVKMRFLLWIFFFYLSFSVCCYKFVLYCWDSRIILLCVAVMAVYSFKCKVCTFIFYHVVSKNLFLRENCLPWLIAIYLIYIYVCV